MAECEKGLAATQLVQAVCSAYEGRPIFAPDALRAMIHNHRLARKPGYHLTACELEVLEFMTKGKTTLRLRIISV